MKYGNARFEAELPDGMYTVKTFHLSDTPLTGVYYRKAVNIYI